MKKYLSSSLVLATFFVCTSTVLAANATITTTTNGSSISADNVGGTYAALTGPIITEGSVGNIGLGTIILNVPSGFIFDTSSNVTATVTNGSCATVNDKPLKLNNSSSQTVTPTATTITHTVTQKSASGATCRATVTYTGIKVRPSSGNPLTMGNITKSGTSVILGVTNGTTNFGTLTEISGAVSNITITSSTTTVQSSSTLSFSATSTDQFGNSTSTTFTWSVIPGTGTGSINSSGLFTAGNVGTVVIKATSGIASGTLNATIIPIPDTIKPVIILNGSSTVTIEKGSTYTDAGAIATDNVDGIITGNIITTGLPINTSATGTHPVVYTVSDAAGNTASSSRTVNVIDTTPPTLSFTDDVDPNGPVATDTITIDFGDSSTTLYGYVSATSSCVTSININKFVAYTGSFDVTSSTISGNVKNGDFICAYGKDASGNIAVVASANGLDIGTPQTVPVITIFEPDTLPSLFKTITAITDIGVFSYATTTGTTCNRPMNFLPYSDLTFSSESDNGIKVCYEAVNGKKKAYLLSNPISGLDTTAPTLSLPSTTTAEATSNSGAIVNFSATASDVNPTNPTVSCTPSSGSTFALGTTTVNCSATDAAGNVSNGSFNVVVQDTTKPIIILNGSNPVQIEVHNSYTESGATVTDNYDTNVTLNITGSVDTDTVGSYTLYYNATDTNGNAANQITRTVNVVDLEAPSTSDNIPGGYHNSDVTVTFTCTDNTSCVKVYYTTDGSDPTASSSFVDNTTSWQFTLSAEGNYTIKYFGVDGSDNQESTKTATNNLVIDKTAPVITIDNSYNHLPTNQDITVNASTNEGTLNTTSHTFSTNGSFDFVATDLAGNISTSTVAITNIDKVAPTITVLGNNPMRITRGLGYSEAGATVFDNVDGSSSPLITGTVNTSAVGTYIITYSATDTAGNGIIAKRTVNVVSGGHGRNLNALLSSGAPVIATSSNTTSGEESTTSTSTVAVGNPATSTGEVLGAEKFFFANNLKIGSKKTPDVVELQNRLRTEGFFTYATSTGYFGTITKEAVKKYQKAHSITFITGFVGSLTRAELNK